MTKIVHEYVTFYFLQEKISFLLHKIMILPYNLVKRGSATQSGCSSESSFDAVRAPGLHENPSHPMTNLSKSHENNEMVQE